MAPEVAQELLKLLPSFHKLYRLKIPVAPDSSMLESCSVKVLSLIVGDDELRTPLPAIPDLQRLTVECRTDRQLYPFEHVKGTWCDLARYPNLTCLKLENTGENLLEEGFKGSSTSLKRFISVSNEFSGDEENSFFAQMSTNLESMMIEGDFFATSHRYKFPKLRSLALNLDEYASLYREGQLPDCPVLERLEIRAHRVSPSFLYLCSPVVQAYSSTLESLEIVITRIPTLGMLPFFDSDMAVKGIYSYPLSISDMNDLNGCRNLKFLRLYTPFYLTLRSAKEFSEAHPNLVALLAGIGSLTPMVAYIHPSFHPS
jgi:hypothetical protein